MFWQVASWNVNSLRVRLPQVLDWLAANPVDVLALQETKLTDDLVPHDAFSEAGYHCLHNGQKTYNGVAILSRHPIKLVANELANFPDPQKRLLIADIGPLRLFNCYVPNGQMVGSDKYQYKLDWLAALTAHLHSQTEKQTAQQHLLVGDFNIAPSDIDVYDPDAWRGKILCSAAEREALNKLLAAGYIDCFRQFDQPYDRYSWWDYRSGAFQRNHGLRIDLILASWSLADTCKKASIDSEPRGWERPSDHAPVIAEFNLPDVSQNERALAESIFAGSD